MAEAVKIAGIRASSLPMMFACLRSLQYKEGSVSNEYADTGSLIHLGIHAFHKLNHIDSALAVMASSTDFPEANASKAAHHFRRYTETHTQWGAVKETEYPIAFKLAPAAFDPTQEEILIEGTTDQIRETSGLIAVDTKTGSKPIKWMMRHYAPQICAYQFGVWNAFGIKPHAAILRTQDYLQGGKVFHPVPWGWDTVIDVMESVKVFIALHRLGLKIAISGDHCDYCPAGGIENCSIGETRKDVKRYALPVATSIEDLFK